MIVQVAQRIDVRGVVQGVGFRPFVYRLATELGLVGSVGNDASGVFINVSGAADSIDQFIIRLQTEAPALAQVNSLAAKACLLYTSPSPRDRTRSRMPSSA